MNPVHVHLVLGLGIDRRLVIEYAVHVVEGQVGAETEHQALDTRLVQLRLEGLEQRRVAHHPAQVVFREAGLPRGGDVVQSAESAPVEVEEAVEHAELALGRQAAGVVAQHQPVEVQRREGVLPGADVDEARRARVGAAERVAIQVIGQGDQRVVVDVAASGQFAADDGGRGVLVSHRTATVVAEQIPLGGHHDRVGVLRRGRIGRRLADIVRCVVQRLRGDHPIGQQIAGIGWVDVVVLEERPVHLHVHRVVEREHVVVVPGWRVPEHMAFQIDTREIQYAHVIFLTDAATGRA